MPHFSKTSWCQSLLRLWASFRYGFELLPIRKMEHLLTVLPITGRFVTSTNGFCNWAFASISLPHSLAGDNCVTLTLS